MTADAVAHMAEVLVELATLGAACLGAAGLAVAMTPGILRRGYGWRGRRPRARGRKGPPLAKAFSLVQLNWRYCGYARFHVYEDGLEIRPLHAMPGFLPREAIVRAARGQWLFGVAIEHTSPEIHSPLFMNEGAFRKLAPHLRLELE